MVKVGLRGLPGMVVLRQLAGLAVLAQVRMLVSGLIEKLLQGAGLDLSADETPLAC